MTSSRSCVSAAAGAATRSASACWWATTTAIPKTRARTSRWTASSPAPTCPTPRPSRGTCARSGAPRARRSGPISARPRCWAGMSAPPPRRCRGTPSWCCTTRSSITPGRSGSGSSRGPTPWCCAHRPAPLCSGRRGSCGPRRRAEPPPGRVDTRRDQGLYDPDHLQTPTEQAMIGPGTTVRGTISGDEDLTIEGRVEGAIRLRKALDVAEGAVVAADVEATTVQVSGRVE
ncbi:MAG: polymer-forming cytoskeletal protein, partial [Myxococcales bacterium]|nr:polymer-forming cytoskeletal protein [Myxococcales bacterium]